MSHILVTICGVYPDIVLCIQVPGAEQNKCLYSLYFDYFYLHGSLGENLIHNSSPVSKPEAVNQAVNQPVNQAVNKAGKQAGNQAGNQAVNQTVNQVVN